MSKCPVLMGYVNIWMLIPDNGEIDTMNLTLFILFCNELVKIIVSLIVISGFWIDNIFALSYFPNIVTILANVIIMNVVGSCPKKTKLIKFNENVDDSNQLDSTTKK